ncbi:unnamed protein product [Sphagnum balticum]
MQALYKKYNTPTTVTVPTANGGPAVANSMTPNSVSPLKSEPLTPGSPPGMTLEEEWVSGGTKSSTFKYCRFRLAGAQHMKALNGGASVFGTASDNDFDFDHDWTVKAAQ